MRKKFKFFLMKAFQVFLYYVIRVYSSSFRLQIENEQPWIEHMHKGGRVLLCCWHQQFFSAIKHFKKYAIYRPSLMISKSNDGDIIARIAEKTGWHTVRGSSSKNGSRALKAMRDCLINTGLAGHILDGPQGPAGIVKAGVVSLAISAGAVVVPFYTSADRAWYFNSWDRFMLPKPFARVTLRFGEMLDITTGSKEADFENQRVRIQEIMRPGLHA